MPTIEELNAALAGVPGAQSGAAYGQADPLANLWEYWRPGGNGGGQAALQAFYNSGRWRESQYGGIGDAQAKMLFDHLMSRYTATPGVPTGSGATAYTPPTTDLPGIHRPPELADAGFGVPPQPAFPQAPGRISQALDSLGFGQPVQYGMPKRALPGYGTGRLV